MSETLTLADFEIRRTSHASSPWRVFHGPTDRQVSILRSLTNVDGKEVFFSGAACFTRKRDAVAWLRDELPSLLAAYLTPDGAK